MAVEIIKCVLVLACAITLICCFVILLKRAWFGLYFFISWHIIRDEHTKSCMTFCAILMALGIFLSYKYSPLWLIGVCIIALFVAMVIYVNYKETKTHTLIAKCDRVHTSFRTVGRSARTSFTISENSLGGGYSGKIYYEPDTRESIEYHNIYFSLPDGNEKSFRFSSEETVLINKYGTLEYREIDSCSKYHAFKFTPYDDQEEGKAAFESKRREASIYKRRKTKSRARSLHKN